MTFSILTVCIGNVCRSPVAERLLASALAAEIASGEVSVSSAGVQAMVGYPIEPHAAAELDRLGGDPVGFAARRLEPHIMEPADLVLTATVAVRGEALGVCPRAMRRTFTLIEFAELCRAVPLVPGESMYDYVSRAGVQRATVAGGDLDIADPMGRSVETHAAVADRIVATVNVIADVVRDSERSSDSG